jgi:simple sugar transport system ATP-binding protein
MTDQNTGASPTDKVPLVEMKGINKRYGAVQALCEVDFWINPREVVGLLGDNGAGKSTLIKMMSGVVQADSGSIYAFGRQVELNSRQDSENLGIETIYQDAALVDTMSVARNIFMGREITNRLGFMNHGRMRTISVEVLESAVQIGGIESPDKLVGELSGGQKQAVAIARAVYFKRSVLLLDEPTSALSVRTTEALLDYIRKLREDGVSSVLVTHNLYHAYQVCDRFVVMGRGRKICDIPKCETTIEMLTRTVIEGCVSAPTGDVRTPVSD